MAQKNLNSNGWDLVLTTNSSGSHLATLFNLNYSKEEISKVFGKVKKPPREFQVEKLVKKKKPFF